MHFKSFLKNALFWYVSLALLTIVSLQFFHVKLVRSLLLEESDRILSRNAAAAANVLHRLATQHAPEEEIRADLELLSTQKDSALSIEVLDSNDRSLFLPSRLDRSEILAKLRDSAASAIRTVTIDGQRSYRIVTMKIEGFTLVAGYPEPTLSEIAAQNLFINRYLLIVFTLFAAFTALFIYNFYARPVHRLNVRLYNILGRTSSSKSVERPHRPNRGGMNSIELTSTMVEQLNEARDRALNFASFASHELRTPLTIIRNQLESALSADLPLRSLRKHVGGVYDDILRLNNTVESLLNLSTMQAGTFSLRIETVPLQQFFKKFYDEALFLTRPKNISVVMGKGPELYISGDAARLRQVFFNLLDNALKNTPPNQRIHLSYELEEEHVLIKFSDSGRGIPADLLPKVFDPFVRGNDTVNHGRGTGLGLALVKLIVDLHGGTISVESIVGKGTTFFLRFPSAVPGSGTVQPQHPVGGASGV